MSDTSLPARHIFDIVIHGIDRSVAVKEGPLGSRMIFNVGGGTFEGERLRGEILAPAGDWAYLQPDGVTHLDVRLGLRTDDGASILMEYQGKAGPDGLRTAPTFQTSAEQYAWLNAVQAVGIGSLDDGVLTYNVYELL